LVAVCSVDAATAQARSLSRATAAGAATRAANRLAHRRPGEVGVRRTRVRCVRRSPQQFACYTTVSGSTLCAPSETACDGPAPFAIPYAITVSLRPAPGARVRVIVRQA
jgi:hypothetical protein